MADLGEITNDILAHLPAEELARARPNLRRVRLVAGQVLYEPGEDVDRVYFPESGLLSIVTPMADGHDVENTSRGRDGGIAYVEATGSGIVVSRVVVQIGGTALSMPASRYREFYDSSSIVRAVMQRRTEFLLAEARQAIACQAMHPTPGRLARMLLECHHHTGDVRFPLTQDFMADMIGVGRTTVTHAASELKRLGYIRYTRGTVTLMDVAGLQRYTCECYETVRKMRETIIGPRRQPRRNGAEICGAAAAAVAANATG